MANTSVRPASFRQLMALHFILKKDTRDMNLTYEEASEMIKKYGNPDYKKSSKKTTKTVKVAEKVDPLEANLIAYFEEKVLPKVVASLRSALNIESEVVEDTNWMKGTGENGEAKHYKFRGFGCSISYLTYDKRSKKAARIEELFRKHRFTTFEKMVVSKFPVALIKKLDAEGCSLAALYCQDYDVNSTLFWGVVNFAKENGVKRIDYVTRLD